MGQILNRRRVMGGKRLPYDAEVEWLSTDGTAYIDTLIATTSDIRVEATFTVTSQPNQDIAIYGGRTAVGDRSNVLYYYGKNNKFTFGFRYGDKETTTNNGSLTGDYVISNLSEARSMVISGAVNATMTCNATTFSIERTMFIFGMNNNGSPMGIDENVCFRVKPFKMYNGTTMVRDYIPVRVGQVGYLYDKVSGQLFGNAAAIGAFIFGNDV